MFILQEKSVPAAYATAEELEIYNRQMVDYITKLNTNHPNPGPEPVKPWENRKRFVFDPTGKYRRAKELARKRAEAAL